MNAVHTFFDWVAKIALLNILWIIFTLLGLGVFGFFPALSASFAIARKWVSGYTDVKVIRSFWKYYKRDFWKSIGLGYILAIVAYILYLDFLFITVYPGDYVVLLTIPFIFISVLFTLTSLYVFPVFVHYQMKISQVLKSAFFIMILNPLPTFVMVLGLAGVLTILYFFQGLFIFFGISVISVVVMMPAYRAFKKAEEKGSLFLESK